MVSYCDPILHQYIDSKYKSLSVIYNVHIYWCGHVNSLWTESVFVVYVGVASQSAI